MSPIDIRTISAAGRVATVPAPALSTRLPSPTCGPSLPNAAPRTGAAQSQMSLGGPSLVGEGGADKSQQAGVCRVCAIEGLIWSAGLQRCPAVARSCSYRAHRMIQRLWSWVSFGPGQRAVRHRPGKFKMSLRPSQQFTIAPKRSPPSDASSASDCALPILARARGQELLDHSGQTLLLNFC
jgi:hypothetical protein